MTVLRRFLVVWNAIYAPLRGSIWKKIETRTSTPFLLLHPTNPSLYPFTGNQPWPHHHFYVNRFYKDGTVGASRDNVESSKINLISY